MQSSKAVPWWPTATATTEQGASDLFLEDLPTPLVTVSDAAIEHNLTTLAEWCAEAGVALAPHGKTTMCQELWNRQLAAGAWGMTVATPWQLSVALDWGVPRIMLANALVQPGPLRAVAELLRQPTRVSTVIVWADHLDTVAIMADALAGTPHPLRVLVELGARGGRTGARNREAAREIAAAIAASPALSLAGVAGYEGALSHGIDAAALAVVRDYLTDLAQLYHELSADGLFDPQHPTIVSAGGSAYFDVVAEVLAPLHDPHGSRGAPTEVILRSGAAIAHDDGFYRIITPLARGGSRSFSPALHGWATVVSAPEPGLALVDAGKRDFPFDEGLPTPQAVRRRDGTHHTLSGATVTAMNDQHSFVSFPESEPLRIGDVVRFGLSHPCTTFDKWHRLPLLDDVHADQPRVLRFLTTVFG